MLFTAFAYCILGGPADFTKLGREPAGGFAFLLSPLPAAPPPLFYWAAAFFIPGNFNASIDSRSLS